METPMGSPLQGILLVLLPAVNLLLAKGPRATQRHLPLAGLALAAALPLRVPSVLVAALLLALFCGLILATRFRAGRAGESALHQPIRTETTRAFPWALPVCFAVGLAVPFAAWGPSLRALPAWVWAAVPVMALCAIPKRFQLSRLLALLGGAAMLISGMWGAWA
jgi:hypothetical protein